MPWSIRENWGYNMMPWGIGVYTFMVESVDICSSRRIGNAPELRQLVSYEAHASFRLDPIGSVDIMLPINHREGPKVQHQHGKRTQRRH